WQLDGIFVGASKSAATRNSAIASVVIYLSADCWLAPAFGNTGVWAAFLVYYLARSATLALAWPGLKRGIEQPN
ncbi:MAG: MATE family efflux transporter, partial [Robiginitomaculum sp.]|nr:MATE family efflux transporter [Robiginitomaculum sp.]